MLYRNIRKKSTGEWVDILFSTTGDSFSVSASNHIESLASGLSIDASDLEAVEGDSDARTGTLIDQPVTSTSQTRQEELMAIGKDSWTDAQQKELIELLATA